MKFREAIASGFANYFNFLGRATAPEFWFWILFCLLGAVVTEIVDGAVFIPHPFLSPLNTIFTFVVLLPSLTVMVRRLHDVGRSGWWLLLVPTGIGIFILLRWASFDSVTDEREYDPLAVQPAEKAA